jgi:hypothetical protein
MSNELERIFKEPAVAKFKVGLLCRHRCVKLIIHGRLVSQLKMRGASPPIYGVVLVYHNHNDTKRKSATYYD